MRKSDGITVLLTIYNHIGYNCGMTALERAIALFPTKTAMAEKFGVHPMSINHWVNRGLPADRVLDVAAATDWAVTPHELAPELYPHPEDGLPPDRRGNGHSARDDEAAA